MFKSLAQKILTIPIITLFFAPLAWSEYRVFGQMGIVKPKAVKQAPHFSLRNIHGKMVTLEQFKGKPILLNFWATWCQACKEEMPSMQRLYDKLQAEGFEILAISIDRSNADRVRKFVTKYNISFPILLDHDQQVRHKYFIMGLPTSYLIDAEGKLRGFVSGARAWDHPTAQKTILSLIKNKPNHRAYEELID